MQLEEDTEKLEEKSLRKKVSADGGVHLLSLLFLLAPTATPW